MRTRIRLGVIGLGTWGLEVVEAAAGHPDVTVVAGADPSESARARLADFAPGARVHSDAHELIESDLDAVYVAAPPAAHAEYVLAALEAGRHVFCEKPLAIDLDEGARMREAAKRTGLVLAVNFALSDRAAVLEVERALLAGEVGDVRGVEVRLAFPEWPRGFQRGATWVAGRAQGGFVREVFSHFAYVTDRLLGPLRVEHARVEWPANAYADATEVAAHALLTADDTVPVSLVGVSDAALAETYEWTLVGSRRSYRLTDWGTLHSCAPGGTWQEVDPPAERGSEVTRLARFAAAVRGEDVEHLADVEAAWRVQQVVETLLATR